MDIHTVHEPPQTEYIRIPVSGPKPCNQLAFIRCSGMGVEHTGSDEIYRYRMRFFSSFSIDGFKQANLDWHRQTTGISATGFLTLMDVKPDMTFILALEDIRGFVNDDGRIGFEAQIAGKASYPDMLNPTTWARAAYSVSAYVLLYEPPNEPPPPPPPPPPGNPARKIVPDAIPPQFGRKKKKFVITDQPGVVGGSSEEP